MFDSSRTRTRSRRPAREPNTGPEPYRQAVVAPPSAGTTCALERRPQKRTGSDQSHALIVSRSSSGFASSPSLARRPFRSSYSRMVLRLTRHLAGGFLARDARIRLMTCRQVSSRAVPDWGRRGCGWPLRGCGCGAARLPGGLRRQVAGGKAKRCAGVSAPCRRALGAAAAEAGGSA